MVYFSVNYSLHNFTNMVIFFYIITHKHYIYIGFNFCCIHSTIKLIFFTVISHLSDVKPEEVSLTLPTVKLMMNAVGGVEVIPETLMDAAGAVSGCGPAYVSSKYFNC